MTTTSSPTYDPYLHAAALGLTVIHTEADLRPQDDGAYFIDRGTIHLRPGMRSVQEWCVLAHENFHAVNGHADSGPKNEVIADRDAAEVLVDRARLIELMSWTPDLARWAHELGVTPKVVIVYTNVHRLDLARGRVQPYRTRLTKLAV